MLDRIERQTIARVSLAGEWLPIAGRLRDARSVALTFDDGPSPSTTRRLLELLEAYRARATFFLCGRRVEAHPDLVAAIVESGNAVYSHGYSHRHMDRLDEARFVDELDRCERLLARFRPTPSPYPIRLPYGSGHDLRGVHRRLRAWRDDVEIVHWSYSFRDWTLADDIQTVAALTARCTRAAEDAFASAAVDGAIMLLHEDAIDSEAPLAAQIAPTLLRELLEQARRREVSVVGLGETAKRPLARFIRPKVVF